MATCITHALLYYHSCYKNHAELELQKKQKHGPLSYLQHTHTNLIWCVYATYIKVYFMLILPCCPFFLQFYAYIKQYITKTLLVKLCSTLDVGYSVTTFHASVLN